MLLLSLSRPQLKSSRIKIYLRLLPVRVCVSMWSRMRVKRSKNYHRLLVRSCAFVLFSSIFFRELRWAAFPVLFQESTLLNISEIDRCLTNFSFISTWISVPSIFCFLLNGFYLNLPTRIIGTHCVCVRFTWRVVISGKMMYSPVNLRAPFSTISSSSSAHSLASFFLAFSLSLFRSSYPRLTGPRLARFLCTLFTHKFYVHIMSYHVSDDKIGFYAFAKVTFYVQWIYIYAAHTR